VGKYVIVDKTITIMLFCLVCFVVFVLLWLPVKASQVGHIKCQSGEHLIFEGDITEGYMSLNSAVFMVTTTDDRDLTITGDCLMEFKR
jgi:hypothetical protein